MKKTLLVLLLAAFLPGVGRADSTGDQLLASNKTLQQNENQDQGQNIGNEDVEPKDPYLATIFSVLPGILFHGAGNFYAEDFDFGTEMLVTEIIGAGISLLGYNMIHQPQHWGQYFGNEMPQAAYWVKAGGVSMLAISWIGDVATAPGAAKDWNQDHQLELQMDSFNATGVRLTLGTRF